MILGTLGGKQIMPCDAVSIYTWFQHHKLDLEGHMYTKAYHYIVTLIEGLIYYCIIYSFTNVDTPRPVV